MHVRHEIRSRLGLRVAAYTVAMAGCSLFEPKAKQESPVRERWYRTQQGFGEARPAVIGDTVLFSTGEPGVVARSLRDGTPFWSAPLRSIAASRAVGGRNILVSNGVAVVPIVRNTVAVDLHSGREIWSYAAPLDTIDEQNPAPGGVDRVEIVGDGTSTFIPASGATVSAVDNQTGSVKWVWRVEASLPFRSGAQGATVSGDTVFVTAWHFLDRLGVKAETWLLALDRTTGALLYRVTLAEESSGRMVFGAPRVFGNTVVFSTNAGRVWGIDRTTRTLTWSFHAPALHAALTGAQLAGDTVFADGGDDRIYALGATDGRVIWKSDPLGPIANELLVAGTRIYASDAGRMFVVDRTNGRLLKSFQDPHRVQATDNLFASPATAAAGAVFVTTFNGAWAFEEP